MNSRRLSTREADATCGGGGGNNSSLCVVESATESAYAKVCRMCCACSTCHKRRDNRSQRGGISRKPPASLSSFFRDGLRSRIKKSLRDKPTPPSAKLNLALMWKKRRETKIRNHSWPVSCLTIEIDKEIPFIRFYAFKSRVVF